DWSSDVCSSDLIGKDQIALPRIIHGLQSGVKQGHVACRLAHLGHAPMREDVADLAHTNDPASGRLDPVKQGVLRRRHGIVAAIGRALERIRTFANERTSDNAAYPVIIYNPARRLAETVEPFEPEMMLMRGDLEDRIGGGIADRLSGAGVLLTQPRDDLRARGVAVAEDAG